MGGESTAGDHNAPLNEKVPAKNAFAATQRPEKVPAKNPSAAGAAEKVIFGRSHFRRKIIKMCTCRGALDTS